MTYNYTTLFDSYYINRALAMHESLVKHCPDFHLYIFAFDEKSEKLLKDMGLHRVTVIPLRDLENQQLLAIKESRSKAEYCWTCTPSTLYYCIEKYNLDHCTYLDADLFFFSNPNVLVDELGNNSVLITEHRYTRRYDQSQKSGHYCVQFMTFRNTAEGMAALTWWRDRCIEWCYDRFEDGKFGDQKYLDDWTTRFKGVHVLQHQGGGVAPWNVQRYDIAEENGKLQVIEKETGNRYDLVFYHFHAVRFLKDNRVDLGAYALSSGAKLLYSRYLESIRKANEELLQRGFQPIVQPYNTKKSIPLFVHKAARRLLGVYQIYTTNRLINYGKTS
jgi:hypothetical protein